MQVLEPARDLLEQLERARQGHRLLVLEHAAQRAALDHVRRVPEQRVRDPMLAERDDVRVPELSGEHRRLGEPLDQRPFHRPLPRDEAQADQAVVLDVAGDVEGGAPFRAEQHLEVEPALQLALDGLEHLVGDGRLHRHRARAERRVAAQLALARLRGDLSDRAAGADHGLKVTSFGAGT
jgi:hypothetical protein